MNFSSRDVGKSTKNQQSGEFHGFNQDPEVGKIHDQIDAVEENITNFKSEIKQRIAFYETEAQNLEIEIKKKEIDKETQLSALREKNAREVLEFGKRSEEEANEVRKQIEGSRNRRNNYHNKHYEALKVRKEAEVAELRRKIDQIRIRNTERGFDTATYNQGAKMEKQARLVELRAQIELIDGEIKDITAQRQEDLQATSLKIQQTSSAFETRCREQNEQLEQYKADLAQRSTQTDEMIAITEKQIQDEVQQIENEMGAAVDRRGKQQQMLERYRKRIAKEERVMQADIAALKAAVLQAKQAEEEQFLGTKDMIVKLQEASSESTVLDQTIGSIRAEVEQIKNDNNDMRRERTRIDTSLYNSRLSRYHSSK